MRTDYRTYAQRFRYDGEADINAALVDDGWTLTATLIRDEFNGRDGAHTFAVTLIRNGQSDGFEYTAGCAHRHHTSSEYGQYPYPKPRRGEPIHIPQGHMRIIQQQWNQHTLPNTPTLVDLLSGRVSAVQSVMYGETFEDWADTFGYDTDSRKAERIYRACVDAHWAFIRMGANLETLGELFQNY